MSDEKYEDLVQQVGRNIRAGDVVQAVVARRWSMACAATDVEVYESLRRLNPSPHMAIVRSGNFSLIAASPELLLDARDGVASTSPIAGTRARGRTRDDDRANAAELRNDPKEQAEHLMLVDLARNDLNRVCVPGSVRVPRFMRTERFAHVMHLTSHVVGQMRTDGVDALQSVFPAGTVSGAPKLRAMELIAHYENERRGPYAGVMVLAGADGSIEAAITLRSIALVRGQAHVHAGAGIVARSTPEGEAHETRSKASAALDAVIAAHRLASGSAP
jgi:anthranilate synthase component 1